MDPFIGEIRPVPYNFAPQGWAFCQGQIMSIAQNTALFSLLGTTFGGDGKSTFGLPDLRGRVPLGADPGHDLGMEAGVEQVSLQISSMPAHIHPIAVSAEQASQASPVGNLPAVSANAVYDPNAKDPFAPTVVMPAGNGVPHPNLQPYLTINYIIALEGIFPPRS